METLHLPYVIGGKLYTNEKDCYKFEFDNLEVILPQINEEMKTAIDGLSNDALSKLKSDEILSFLERVGRLWLDPEYHLRKDLMKYGPIITGHSAQMYSHNIGLILSMLLYPEYMNDMLEDELYHKGILDEWIDNKDAYIHAVPLGKILHIASGNVALAGFYSVVRGILTKNINIVKISGRELVTVLFFIRSLADVDPNHPITLSTAGVYWGRNDTDLIEYYTNFADGVCLWGNTEMINAYKSVSRLDCEIIEYGPKTSMQIIEWDENGDPEVPHRSARDICVFDQEACFSPQILFFKGNLELFIEELQKGLEEYNGLWPKGQYNEDHYIHMNYVIYSNAYNGNKSYQSEKLDWLIVHKSNDDKIELDHPLGRTIYIYTYEDISTVMDYIGNRAQTVGVEPKELAVEIRDELAQKGVTRISNVGFVETPRMGLVHQSNYLSRLVKISGMEKSGRYTFKNYTMSQSSASVVDQFDFYLNK